MDVFALIGRTRRGEWLAALVAPLVLVALVAPAAAAPTWITPATDVSQNSGSNFSNPLVAVGPSGDVAVVFDLGATLKLVTRPPGGTFSTPVDLTTTMQAGIRRGVAVDGAGNTYVVWSDTTGGTGGSISSIKAAVKPAGAVATVSTLETASNPDEPNIAVTPGGNAVAVWRRGTELRMARRAAGGSFGSAFTVFPGNTIAGQPQIDINAGGDTVLGFRQRIGGGNFFCMALFQPAASSAASVAVFNPGAGAANDDAPSVGVDNAGNASVLCGREGTTIKVSNKPAGSNTWSAISGANGTVDATVGSTNPVMAWNDAGQQAAMWNTGTTARLVAATRSGFGSFSTQEIGAPSGGVFYVQGGVAVDPNGVALAVFNRSNVMKSFRSSGASWSPQNDLSSTGNPSSMTVGVDDQGNGAAAFVETNPNAGIRAAGFDGAGPKLNNVSFPSTATPGISFPFSATPADVWSTVASTGWTFGEGSSFSGAAGNFAYGVPGSFTATVTSTDSRGNSNSTARTVAVATGADQPPVGGPPPITPPSNAFSFGKLKKRSNGSATLTVEAASDGTLTAADAQAAGGGKARRAGKHKPLIKPVTTSVTATSPAKLRLKPTKTAAKRLKRGKSVRVKVLVTFTPTGGTAASQTKRVALKRKRR